jgi:hypothetical protein
MYGLRTAVHLFHGVWGSSVSRYFVGVEMLNASTSGRRKGMKPLVTVKYVLKHRQTTVIPQQTIASISLAVFIPLLFGCR